MDPYTGGPELPTGAELLDAVETFIGRFAARLPHGAAPHPHRPQ